MPSASFAIAIFILENYLVLISRKDAETRTWLLRKPQKFKLSAQRRREKIDFSVGEMAIALTTNQLQFVFRNT